MWLRRLGIVVLLSVALSGGARGREALARETHSLPPGAQEFQAYDADHLGGYVVRGCLHPVSGSVTAVVPACQAYPVTPMPTPFMRYVEDPTARALTYTAGDGDYWLLVHPDTTTAVAGWTRVTGSYYLWQQKCDPPRAPGWDAVAVACGSQWRRHYAGGGFAAARLLCPAPGL